MINDFIVKCYYVGSEDYKLKDKDETITLYEFLDSLGNSFKLALQNFDGEKDKAYLLNVRLGDSRRDGTYRKYWRVTPVEVNETEQKEA